MAKNRNNCAKKSKKSIEKNASKSVSMRIINEHAAGIDVGSRSHYVAVGQDVDKDVREFGVFDLDLRECAAWLKSRGVETVAMESTGSYWQNLYDVLIESGFKVLLVCGRQTKNMESKTDVKDSRWIQFLHTVGLLTSSFLPDLDTEELRTIYRHRDFLLKQGAKYICKMQKCLRLMNFRLDVVLSDITGLSGQAIIRAIISGVTDPQKLAELADWRVKATKDEIARALSYNGREDYLYELTDSFDIYQSYVKKIEACDKKMDELMQKQIVKLGKPQTEPPPLDHKKKVNKNSPKIPLEKLSWQWNNEVNLMSIKGVSHSTVLTINSEIGQSIDKFHTAKAFTSWLRLSPNNRTTGGKVISTHVRKGSNRVAAALRHAAKSIGNQKDAPLNPFYQRIKYRQGDCAAIIATARKLAVIIWNMLIKKEKYKPYDTTKIESQIRDRNIKKINKLMRSFNVQVSELNFTVA